MASSVTKHHGVLSEEVSMDDPKQFGLELADRTVARMESEGLGSEEAAIFAAKQIVERADEMVAASRTRAAAATWTEAVTAAYGARLDERIRASEELTELPREKPQ